MADDLPIFPVSEWDIRSVPAYQILLLRLGFLSHATQKPEEADPGRNYALTLAQAAELRDAIDRALQKMQTDGVPPIPPAEKH